MEEDFSYGAYNEETTGIFRYVKVLHISDYTPVKSYKGYDEFGYYTVRVLIDLMKDETKIADFRFTGRHAKLAKRLKVGKFYKFAFSFVYQNFKNKFKNDELTVRVQQDIFDVYKIDYKAMCASMFDVTEALRKRGKSREVDAMLKEIYFNIG